VIEIMSEKLLQTDDKSRLFELYLVSFMRVDPDVIRKALGQLHSTEAELEVVKNSMKGRGYEMIGGPDVEFYLDLVGQPVSEQPIDNDTLPEVFHNSKELHFKLSLWPDFDFVVNELPDGRTFDASFRRTPNLPVPPLTSFSDLEPWKFVKEELDSRFGLPQVGDAWDNWEELDYMIPKSPGEPTQKCSLLFDFNLLQSADGERASTSKKQ
jgi:hypothetical protein